jgi:predicted amidohydrolase
MVKIALLQTDILWAGIETNHNNAEKSILSVKEGVDLFVLPEMWSTGFAVEPEGIAEEHDESLLWMKKIAAKTDAAVAGSVAVKQDGRYHNRFFFVKPDGEVAYYDKRHLFTYGGEAERYTAGTERVVVEWRGARFLLQTCYDLRFPCFSRNHSPYYDCILYVASWPSSRRPVWDVLLQARALENQCYVVGVNRVGNDAASQYNGGSVIVSPYGKTIVQAKDDKAEVIIADIDIDKLHAFRKKFPVLEDRDR